jgi:hypothetical protein
MTPNMRSFKIWSTPFHNAKERQRRGQGQTGRSCRLLSIGRRVVRRVTAINEKRGAVKGCRVRQTWDGWRVPLLRTPTHLRVSSFRSSSS